MLVYLDRSATVKRYMEEIGSQSSMPSTKSWRKKVPKRVAFSIWNMGEVFGAIDTRRQGEGRQESRNLILKHHMYQADALQLGTARESESALILTADRKLAECAKSEEIQGRDPERDHDPIVSILGKKP